MLGVLALTPSLHSRDALAQGAERSGKDVVDSVCVSCHGAGVDNAPRIGDKEAWAPRASRGLTQLSQNALDGIRKMPPHGGNPSLSDLEIKRAITYMVNKSGGQWTEPISRTAPSASRSGAKIVQTYCFKCHQTGVGGAPRIGESAAWIPRAKEGFDVLVRSAINGHGGMPPRGGVANLTDAEARDAITFMLNPVITAAKPAAPPDLASDNNHRVIEGMEIYFGVAQAEILARQHPGNDTVSAMHGGIPRGHDQYHVNISLFDTGSKAPIRGARIAVTVTDPVMGNQVKALEPMLLNKTPSYGNYFRLPGNVPYTVAVRIQKKGASRALETTFHFQQ
jgi:cytochrome c5